jgi:MoaA/NifB/PqqE/SkfB family radical SAM enzyme
LERPGGGGRSHRPERREAEIEYLKEAGVRVVISLMTTRHNLDDYEDAGMQTIHLPVAQDADGLAEAVDVLRRETRKPGVVAIHDNRYTDFVAAICAEHLREHRGYAVERSLERAMDAGLVVTANAAALVEADPDFARSLPETPAGHPAYF